MRHKYSIGAMIGLIGTLACDSREPDTIDTSAGILADSAGMYGGGMRDTDIVASLTAANASGITLGELAEQRATDAEVKSFARMVASDHRQMNELVDQIAQQLGLVGAAGEHTADVDDNSKDWAEELRDKTGREFDAKFMQIMVESHKNTLDLLDRASSSTTTQQLNAAIMDARPKVRQHLDRARQIQERLGGE